jgi:DNA polymerase-3 subunit beta
VLTGIRLTATAGELTATAYDYETSAAATIPVVIGEEGTVLLPGRLLAEIVRGLPSLPVQISTDPKRAIVTCGQVKFTVPALPADAYPQLPRRPPVAGTVGAGTFAAAIGQVMPATTRDPAVPALTGVLIEVEGNTITLAATDRFRLAFREINWQPATPGLSTRILVPAQALADAARMMTASTDVTIGLDPVRPAGDGPAGSRQAAFTGSGWATTTTAIAGAFPRYRAFLPTESTAAAELPAAAAADALKRVALVAERNAAVHMVFTPGQLRLEASTGDEAWATELVDAAYDGHKLRASFNPDYLLEGLAGLESDVARLAFTGAGKPVLITGQPATGEAPAFQYVLMPVRAERDS